MVVVAIFLFCLLLGIPIAFLLGITGVAYIFTMDDPRFFNIIIQRMFSGINSFSMMAIPFFVLAGELMNKGGITERLVAFIRECVGFLQGGLAYVVIIVAAILSAILGSANAVAAILCTALFPELVKDKYDKGFSCALVASSGVLGPTVPPSIGFILFAVLTGASVQRLFLGGILPGILICLGYMLVIFLYSRKNNLPKIKEKIEPRNLLKAFINAAPSLLVPLVIVGGVLMGVFTPTESGAVAAAIALCGGFFYRTLKLSDLPKIFFNTSIVTSSIMLIISFGNIMGWALAMDQIPHKLSGFILNITSNPNVIMLLVLLCLVVIGTVIEGFAAMLIFAPVFAPLITSAGFDLVHFGVIFSIMINIGLITPPVGMVLFVTSNITKTPLSVINKSVIPFFIAAFAVTFSLAFLPEITLLLPNLFGK